MTLRRDDALRALIPHIREDDIVVAVYQTNFDWMALNPRDLNYVAVGAMGQASSHGLGLAIANPDRRVIVLDGDGSLLMNLGSMVTIAGAQVTNLYHFVFANRVYEVNGSHPLPSAERVDFSWMALAAGYKDAFRYSDLDSFTEDLPAFLSGDGPQMAALEIVAGEAYPRDYAYIHSAEARKTFADALNR
ncbi:thiamine pyrophosphate-dependent enzyme [Cochlodiniinecator piscidefendens]|uniref:thiamine pyrophosphate-dependent enzyme n=1 Tax=Cochlodiniinecator piscidefendens TaxID=2715756 RepID=UPI00140C72A4|nr:thiamine pyrophosphate-dependent enzyme [Cochlodiniinecator piscidefendens]